MKTLIITNSRETSSSLARYMNYTNYENESLTYAFNDLRVIPREILEIDFIISESYRVEENTIDDYGLDMFLSFLKRGKKGILLHIDRIENLELRIQEFLFKLPGEMRELARKIEDLNLKEKIELSDEDVKLLKDSFPYRVIKDHHRRHHAT